MLPYQYWLCKTMSLKRTVLVLVLSSFIKNSVYKYLSKINKLEMSLDQSVKTVPRGWKWRWNIE